LLAPLLAAKGAPRFVICYEQASQKSLAESAYKMFGRAWNYAPWFKVWCAIGGIISALVSGFYLYASIALLTVKQNALSYFYRAVGLAAVWVLIRSFVMIKAIGIFGIAMPGGGLMGFVVHVVLIIVVATSDKTVLKS
jgi:hypothetical protein